MKDDEAESIYRLFLGGIMAGREISGKFSFDRPPSARDLAYLEKIVNGLVTILLREHFKCRVPGRAFRIDFRNMGKVDDGDDNGVILRLDFGKLLPWERPPEMITAGEELMAASGAPRGWT